MKIKSNGYRAKAMITKNCYVPFLYEVRQQSKKYNMSLWNTYSYLKSIQAKTIQFENV